MKRLILLLTILISAQSLVAQNQLERNYLRTGAGMFPSVLNADPLALREGQFYWNAVDKKLYIYNGTAWVEAGSVPNPLTLGEDDVTKGGLTLMGSSGDDSGILNIYSGANNDTEINYWSMYQTSSGFQFMGLGGTNGSTTPIWAVGNNDGLLQLPRSNNAAIDAGSLNVATTKRWVQDYVAANQGSGADNLGNHTATTNITLNGNSIIDQVGNDFALSFLTGGIDYVYLGNTSTQNYTTFASNGINQTLTERYVLSPNEGAVISLDRDNNSTTEHFVIGFNNQSVATPSGRLFRVIEDGTITAENTEIADITNGGAKSLITKEYADANYSGGGGADNLGNHTATQNLDMGNFNIQNIKSSIEIVDVIGSDTSTITRQSGATRIIDDVDGSYISHQSNEFWINNGNHTAEIEIDLLTANRSYDLPDKSGIIALTSDIETATAEDVTVIDLVKQGGQNDFGGTAANAATFTLGTIEVGGYREVLYNSATEPTVTGATKFPNTASFIANTDMILCVKDFNGTRKYWFVEF